MTLWHTECTTIQMCDFMTIKLKLKLIGWSSVSVWPHQDLVSRKPWQATLLFVSVKIKICWGRCLIALTILLPSLFLLGWFKLLADNRISWDWLRETTASDSPDLCWYLSKTKTKTGYKKIEALICCMNFPLSKFAFYGYKFLIQCCMECCFHVWVVLLIVTWVYCVSKRSRKILWHLPKSI